MEPVVDRNDDRIGGECTVALGNSTRKRFRGYIFLPTCWVLLSRRDDLLHLFPISSLLHSLCFCLLSSNNIYIYYYLFVSLSSSFSEQSFKFLFPQFSLESDQKENRKEILFQNLSRTKEKYIKSNRSSSILSYVVSRARKSRASADIRRRSDLKAWPGIYRLDTVWWTAEMDRNRVRSFIRGSPWGDFLCGGHGGGGEEGEEKGHAWCARTRNDVVQVQPVES